MKIQTVEEIEEAMLHDIEMKLHEVVAHNAILSRSVYNQNVVQAATNILLNLDRLREQ